MLSETTHTHNMSLETSDSTIHANNMKLQERKKPMNEFYVEGSPSGSNPQEVNMSDCSRDSGNTGGSARSVSFSTVEVRQYERVLGDNPSCSSGPPISIGWNYDEAKTVVTTVDDHDDSLSISLNGEESIGKIEARMKMVVQRHEREDMLENLGYSRSEIASAIRENVQTKKKRRQTVNNLNMEPIELMVESVVCCKRGGGVY